VLLESQLLAGFSGGIYYNKHKAAGFLQPAKKRIRGFVEEDKNELSGWN
jgi:hypothetical protein